MNVHELQRTLASLGKPDMEVDFLKRLMSEHDKDDSGTIDANEFAMIMVNEFCRTDVPRGVLVNKATNKPYEIPTTGGVVIDVNYECDAPSSDDIGEDDGIDAIIKAIRDAKIKIQQAQQAQAQQQQQAQMMGQAAPGMKVIADQMNQPDES
jgi:hypothetical protein